MVYSQKNIEPNKFIRVFKESVDTNELKWHQDQYDRDVYVESGKGWMLQMDEELPQELQEGKTYKIPKMTYHRVIKGTGDLKITVVENKTYRIPKKVKENIKRGLFYLKKSGKNSFIFEKLSMSDNVDYRTLMTFKNFFDGHRHNVVLSENYKGKPHQDNKYIGWLLMGGDTGYNWVIRETKKGI
jgi:hypothetical protein